MTEQPIDVTAPSGIDAIYRRRAEQLAARRTVAAPVSTLAVLVVGLGAERYAIELSEIAQVLPYSGCTSVPGASRDLIGVLNVRGDIRAILDLRRVLGLETSDASATGYVLLLRRGGQSLGLKVDRIDHLRQLDSAQFLPAGSAAIRDVRHIRALTTDAVMLIDTSAALSHLDSATT